MVGEHQVQQGTAAQLAQQLARGDVPVEYSLVRALPRGGIKMQAFKIDAGQLHLGDLHPSPVGAGR